MYDVSNRFEVWRYLIGTFFYFALVLLSIRRHQCLPPAHPLCCDLLLVSHSHEQVATDPLCCKTFCFLFSRLVPIKNGYCIKVLLQFVCMMFLTGLEKLKNCTFLFCPRAPFNSWSPMFTHPLCYDLQLVSHSHEHVTTDPLCCRTF